MEYQVYKEPFSGNIYVSYYVHRIPADILSNTVRQSVYPTVQSKNVILLLHSNANKRYHYSKVVSNCDLRLCTDLRE